MVGTWKRLGSTTLASTADTITVDSLEAKKHLMVQYKIIPSGTLDNVAAQFNNDTGNNYAYRVSVDGSADSTITSNSKLRFRFGGAVSNNFLGTLNIINESTKEKLVISDQIRNNTNGAGNAPSRAENVGKWDNTSNQITRVDISQDGSGSFAADSYVTVWGASDDVVTDEKDSLTNVPANTRYEETDTRKIYRKVTPTVNTYTFNGTSGWDFRSGTSGTITGGNVVCTGMGSGLATANNNVHDLQDELGSGNNASATAWVLRGKYKNSTTSNYVFFGLTSVDQTNPPNNSPQDYIGWSSYKSSSSDNGLDIRDNGSPDPSGKGNASVNNTNWYWIEIVRDSSSATLKLYTEANEFTGTPAFTDTESIPSGVENLRYIKFGATHNGGGSAYLTDVKFYNGATSVESRNWIERNTAT